MNDLRQRIVVEADTSGIDSIITALKGLDNQITGVKTNLSGLENDFKQLNTTVSSQAQETSRAYQSASAQAVSASRNIANTEKQTSREVAQAKKTQSQQEKQSAREVTQAIKAKERAEKQAAKEASKQARERQQAIDREINELNKLRYTLYDVSTTYGVIAAAGAGALTVLGARLADFEWGITTTARLGMMDTTAEIDNLADSMLRLGGVLRTPIQDLNDIASVGSQLGVANENLAAFTKTIGEFSSMTGLDAEGVATDIGRLAQLSGTDIGEINRLGSAIYYTGINAVATEASILSLGSQIATATNLAGLSADQTVALASALASLGIQPERARGTLQRVFGDIRAAVDGGGEALQDFANAAGVTSEEFANMWMNTPQEALTAFVDGLRRASEAGQDTNAMLKELGLNSVRDRQLLEALANNMDVYTQALEDTSYAWADGGILDEATVQQMDTILGWLGILNNQLTEFATKVLPLDTIKGLVAGVSEVFDMVNAIVDIPIGGFTARMLGLVAAYHTLRFAIRATTAMLRASQFAIVGANEFLKNSDRSLGMSFTELARKVKDLDFRLTGRKVATDANTVSTIRATQANRGYAMSVDLTTGALIRQDIAQKNVNGSTNASAASVGRLKGILGGLKGGLIGLGVAVAGTGLSMLFDKLVVQGGHVEDSLRDRMKALEDTESAYVGLSEALAQDTKLGEEHEGYVSSLNVTLSENQRSLNDAGKALQSYTGITVTARGDLAETNTKVSEQTLLIGENTEAWIANQIAQGEIGKAWGDIVGMEGFEDTGLRLDVWKDAMAGNAEATEIWEASLDTAKKKLAELEQQAVAGNAKALGGVFEGVNPFTGEEGLYSLSKEYENYKRIVEGADSITNNFTNALDEQGQKALLQQTLLGDLANTTDDYGSGADEATLATERLNRALESAEEQLISIQGSSVGVEEAFYSLGQAIGENGTAFDVFSESGRDNIKAVQSAYKAIAENAGDDTQLLTTNLIRMMNDLQASGVDTTTELGWLSRSLDEITQNEYGVNLSTAVARGELQEFIREAFRAQQVLIQMNRAKLLSMRNTASELNSSMATGVGGAVSASAKELEKQLIQQEQQLKNLKSLQTATRNTGFEAGKTGKSYGEGLKNGADKARDALDKANDKAKDTAKDVAETVRTLLDYASEVQSVFDRAFQIRFEQSQAYDNVQKVYDGLKKSAEDSAEKIRDLNKSISEVHATISGLNADRKILEYQLSVAVEYNDTLREAQIRGELAKVNSDLNDNYTKRNDYYGDITAEQDALSKSLSGNTDVSRENRRTVEGLVNAYRDQILALIRSGASTEEVNRKTRELKNEFIQQLTQMGYNRAEVDLYAIAFDDLAVAINNVPKNITISADTNPAQQALNEFVARNQNKTINYNANVSNPGTVSGGAWNPTSMYVSGSGTVAGGFNVLGAVQSSVFSARNMYVEALSAVKATLGNVGNFLSGFYSQGGEVKPAYLASGGFPGGPKGVDTVPAWLEPGEWVMRRKAVEHYGPSFMNAVNNLQAPGLGGNGIVTVEIMPTQLQALMSASGTTITLDGRVISDTVNRNNSAPNTRGL